MRNQLNRGKCAVVVLAIAGSLLMTETGHAAVTPLGAQRARLEEPSQGERTPVMKQLARMKRLILRALEELTVPKP